MLAAAAAVLLALAAPSPRALEPGVAARVNGVAITTERLDRYFEDFLAESGRNVAAIRSPTAYAALRQQALERLVDTELLWQESQRQRRLATRAEVDAALAEVRAAFRRPGAYEQRLSRGGFTEASYAEYLRVQLSIRRLVQEEIVPAVKVTEADLDAAREEARRTRPDLPAVEVDRLARGRAASHKAEAALAERLAGLRGKAAIEVARAR
jgi:parvulin-like peptidyl-prolyl isomerase